MKPAECNYDVHDKELSAIVQALKEWRRYLKGSGQHFRVLTEDQNLIRLTTTKELTGRQIRWSEVLSGFDFKIEYRPGKEAGKPAALTRRKADMPQEGDERLTQKERILLPKEKYFDTSIQEMETMRLEETSHEEHRNETARNEEIQTIRKALKREDKEMKGVALGLCQWKDEYVWHQGKIWVPNKEGIRTNLIRQHHDIPQAGHGGTAKTTELLQRKYYWPHMRNTIKKYVKNCDICQRTKVVRHAPYGLIKPNEAPDRPWKSICMDFITDLPKSEGDDAILIVIDRLTKMAHFLPCTKEMNARQFSELFHEGNISITWAAERYHDGSRIHIHFRFMERNTKTTRDRTKIEYGISPSNGRTNGTNEFHFGTIPPSIRELSTRQLEGAPTNGGIRIQQWISRKH